MEKYKKTVTKRLYFLIAIAILAVGFAIFDMFFASPDIKANEVFAFQSGLAMAIGFLSLLLIFRYRKILKNEAELQLQYNKENDERMKTIRAKMGMPALLISSILMIGAAFIASFFSIVAFYTLIVAAICQMLFACVIKLIYSKLI